MNNLLHAIALKCLHYLPAETAHNLALASLRLTRKKAIIASEKNRTETCATTKLTIPLACSNRLGLAAGFDKDGRTIDGLASLGFGFIELGTVTPKPQPGNPKPRMFRLAEHQAIINRMGFNNLGVAQLALAIRESTSSIVKGVNIGKNKDTPLDTAIDDYLYCLNEIYCLANYIVINVSSPNTPELRNLQFGKPLENLLGRIAKQRDILATTTQNIGSKEPKAVLVKIAPDIESDQLEKLIKVINNLELDGLVATNTTIDKSQVKNHRYGHQQGGLSGMPLRNLSQSLISRIRSKLKAGKLIIASGGISSAGDAQQALNSGADLIQIYTGFVYKGQNLINEICSLDEVMG